MSKAEIEELAKLTPEERWEIIAKVRQMNEVEWLDDGELTDEEKRIILDRLDACEKDPNGFIPWEEAKARLKAEFKR
jgi:putative addiction module component (TIGR02574 family)